MIHKIYMSHILTRDYCIPWIAYIKKKKNGIIYCTTYVLVKDRI